MYLTYLYLRKNLKALPELSRLDIQYPKEKGVLSFFQELKECIHVDLTKNLDNMSELLFAWFFEEGYLI